MIELAMNTSTAERRIGSQSESTGTIRPSLSFAFRPESSRYQLSGGPSGSRVLISSRALAGVALPRPLDAGSAASFGSGPSRPDSVR